MIPSPEKDIAESVLRRILVCLASIAVVILALRSAIGPFHLWGFHTLVNSPFTAENILWIAIFALLCLGHAPTAAPTTNQSPRIHLAIVLCVITLAFAHNLADPFLSDDYILLNVTPFTWKAFLAGLNRPGGDGAFRPLGTVYYQLVKSFAGMSPVKWHSVGFALHLLNSALVFRIAWQLWRDKTTAAIASLVFGINGTRPEAALWTAGACDLLACACVLGAISLALSKRTLAVSLLLVAAGVLCKESAYAAPLIALAIVVSRPFLIGSTAVCAALFAWRWHLFHGPGGYINPATGQPAILSLNPLTAAKALLLRIWDILLAPINWDASLSWWLPLSIIASLTGLLLLASNSRSRATPRIRLCLIAATCCAVLPAIHLALIGPSELGSRVLYLPGAPFALLVGSLTLNAGKRTIVLSIVMLAGMTGILEHNLSAWHKAAMEAQTLCRNPQPGAPIPGTFEGVFLFQNGFLECVAAARAK